MFTWVKVRERHKCSINDIFGKTGKKGHRDKLPDFSGLDPWPSPSVFVGVGGRRSYQTEAKGHSLRHCRKQASYKKQERSMASRLRAVLRGWLGGGSWVRVPASVMTTATITTTTTKSTTAWGLFSAFSRTA